MAPRGLAGRVYALLLRAFPRGHRERFAPEMVDAFERELAVVRREEGAWRALRFCLAAWLDALGSGAGERGRARVRRPRRASGGRLDAFRKDLLHAARSLSKAKTFTAVCVVSLAVGIGGNVGVYLFLKSLWTPPPGVRGEGLVELVVVPMGAGQADMSGPSDAWSWPDLVDVREADTGLEVTAWAQGDAMLRTDDGEGTASVPALYVSPDYLATVGVAPARGRDFAPGDAGPPAARVAIVGWDLWQNRLGGRSDVVGSTLTINRADHTVIGVAPPGFQGHRVREGGRPAHLWLPVTAHPAVVASEDVLRDRGVAWVSALARLPGGMDVGQADAALSTVMARLEAAWPRSNADKGARAIEYSGVPALMRFELGIVQSILASASGLVLLVVCLNVAGMVLVRSATRERELAVRLAMGSSRFALVRYLLSESLVLAVASGTLAVAGLQAVLRLFAWRTGRPLPETLEPDLPLLGVSVGLALVVTFAVGLWPALRFSRPGLFSALRDESGAGGGRRTGKVHRLAAAAQAGLALPFLVIGAIYLHQAKSDVGDVGFRPEGLYAAPLDLSVAGYDREAAQAFLRRLQDEVAAVDGVREVAFGGGLPLDFVRRPARVAKVDDPERVWAQTTRVSEGYFDAIGARVVRGRDIGPADRAGGEPVAVVTQSLASLLWPSGDPLGERVTFSVGETEERTYTVVGVAADVAGAQLADDRSGVYVPLAQHPGDPLWVVARSAADRDATVTALQETVTALDPNLLRPQVTTGPDLLDESMGDFLVAFIVSGMFAAIALALAALGIYGVVAFAVASRTREFGVRMAMGASRGQVLKDVFADAVRLALPGVVGGLALVSVFIRVKGDLPPTTPALLAGSFGAAVAIAVGFVILASLGPALRAARVQPAEAMRGE